MKKIDELLKQKESLKAEVRNLMNSNKIDEADEKMKEVRNLEKAISLQKELDQDEEREVEQELEKREERKESDNMNKKDDLQYRAIAKHLLGKDLTTEERASVNVGDSGAILPQDFVSKVQLIRKSLPSLKSLCHVIPVTKNDGKMPIATVGKKLANLQTDQELVKEMIKTSPISYEVSDFGKIVPVENQVLDDAGINFIKDVIGPDFAESSVITENDEILKVIAANSKEVEVVANEQYKTIKKVIKQIPSAIRSDVVIITNSSGAEYLDNLVDANKRPLMSSSLKDEMHSTFSGKSVIELDDEVLPGTEEKPHVFYVANLYALCKFFDRKQYEIAQSKEAGFVFNQTFVRVIERFDVVAADTRAVYKISF